MLNISTKNILKKNKQSIFLFHGVINKKIHKVRNYNNKHILKDDFYKFLIKLKMNGNSISMNELVYSYENKVKIPSNSFCITFDDGFYNNYKIAAPILNDLNIHSTFYICTDFILNNRMSWIDRIDAAVEQSNGVEIEMPWGIMAFDKSIKSKINFLTKIRKIIKTNTKYDPIKFSDKIQKLLIKKNFDKSNDIIDKKLSIKNVKELLNNSLFSIGGHSHKHKIFSGMSKEECRLDIKKSITLIKRNITNDLIHYSYPEGLPNSFTNREMNILKKFNIICCPSAQKGYNNLNSNLFNLKRIFVV